MTPTVQQHLKVCIGFLGETEHPHGSNQQRFSRDLGRPPESWCADFQVDCARISGLTLPGDSAYTPTLAQSFQDAGRWGQTPRVGALVFFAFPGEDHEPNHVGIVEHVPAGGGIDTIEGNSDANGSRTGGSVVRHHRTDHIYGYGYPRYATKPALSEENDMTPEEHKLLVEIRKIVAVTDDRVNKLEQQVAAMQKQK